MWIDIIVDALPIFTALDESTDIHNTINISEWQPVRLAS